jgi:hypothetical protein
VINFVDRALSPKPDLIVHASDLPATAEALRDLFVAKQNNDATNIEYQADDAENGGHAWFSKNLGFISRLRFTLTR